MSLHLTEEQGIFTLHLLVSERFSGAFVAPSSCTGDSSVSRSEHHTLPLWAAGRGVPCGAPRTAVAGAAAVSGSMAAWSCWDGALLLTPTPV